MMTLSMMLQSKISKTRKKLSKEPWLLPMIVVLACGLFSILSFCVRMTTISWNYGMVSLNLPVMPVALNEPMSEKRTISHGSLIDKHTPTIVLTADKLLFGHLEAFTTGFANPNNKFSLEHQSGSPQVSKLLEDMRKWHKQQANEFKIPNPGFVILVPDETWPFYLVIQIIAIIKSSDLYDKVVLAGGFV